MNALSVPDPAEAADGAARPAAVLQVRGISKSFGEQEVLRGIDLTVGAHEVVCLIGASGSGKSTLLRCVNLLEPLSAGSILLSGQDVQCAALRVRHLQRHRDLVGSDRRGSHLYLTRPARLTGFELNSNRHSGDPWHEHFGCGAASRSSRGPHRRNSRTRVRQTHCG